MKRIITGLALASAAALVTAAPAQAAPKNPVAAVKKQFVAGHGVKFVDRATISSGGVRDIVARRTGTYEFGKSGVKSSDITGKFAFKASDFGDEADSEFVKALTTPERAIKVGKSTYLSGGLWSTLVPDGSTWLKVPGTTIGGVTDVYGQPLNITELATLKTLLKGAKPAAGGYAGKITVRDLREVSTSFRAAQWLNKPKAKTLKSVISWRITLDARGLPTRLVSTFPGTALASDAPKGLILSVDTRFTGWGSKVSIKAPNTDEVTTNLEDGQKIPDSLTLPLGSIAH
ncbi:hypothetical protein [Nonomuraea cavernae]|uniref:Lipoprotein n=1 Tax=Nonomuraea cavernae TaxID=2045107 RepID=A0A917Z3N2_9ACTN|nr:hypothetical protein [Nonomuraea cavernae]MCA2188716.1 hypothetical protein [Nonomuraea cavernae]GGO74197.1 hypothetical protein GCM10012289_46280 [Nonomuraea cavernae]